MTWSGAAVGVVGQIAELMPPPVSAVVAPPWDEALPEVGFAFPADFRDFADLYGGGSINDGIIIEVPTLGPNGSGKRTGFGGFVDQSAAVVRSEIGEMWQNAIALNGDQTLPSPVLPEPSGLMMWGYNQFGETCFWDTRDADPDRWTVVAFFSSSRRWERFDGGMADFVLATLQGNVPFAEDMFRVSAGQPEWERFYDWAG